MTRYADPGAVEEVESGGGPLTVVPEAVLSSWSGADNDESETDDGRACGVDGYTGLVAIGQSQALVLGDDPTSTSVLPERDLFVRWCAAESEEELLGSVDAALAHAAWEPERHRDVPGPVVLFDSAWPGDELEPDSHLRVELGPGRYSVRAAHVEPDPETSLHLVQLRRLP
ncbi:Imm21 family immunity protein [Streptomyces sp. NPDC102409]|uniref:Imm21 family immunity protein n=1 Tax=Streptomyces sp. NPDC102409 TaxID=3366172 RepID=UPI0037F8C245